MKQYYRNQYLFSEIYLEEITQLEEDRSLLATFQTFAENRLYADIANLETWNESFVHELLQTLKFRVDKIDNNLALLKQYGEDDIPLAVCYSLLPNEDLDNSTMGSNYAYEIISALKNHNLKWGILTNGNKWRIYHTDEPTPYENYLEIDLKTILDDEAKQAFQLIFFFLKAENFVNDEEGECEFDFFKTESQEKIEYIEKELKNALKQKEEDGKDILSNICLGYVQYLRKNGTTDFSDDDLRDEIYGGSLLYMFRLLFLFYAQARGLMEKDDALRFQIIVDTAKEKYLSGVTDSSNKELWVNLRNIFGEIDNTYNGGLFNRDENQYTNFIEDAWITDSLLAAVIYNMSHYQEQDGQMKLISYRDMNVRHLGTLYEGLLEHKLFIAEEDTEIKVTKKAIEFIPESKGGRIITGKYIEAGQVYFGNDKGLRKATGSYYTPEYIVEYIVNNTVDEKLKELKENFDKQIEPLKQDFDIAISDGERQNISVLIKDQLLAFNNKEILQLSVLDPAMGSGHFLVNATSHIANFITDFLNSYGIKSDVETDSKFWSRLVVENCIYGVDLNILATELAKLSLWILTMAKDKPLSFLNHHLKIGNSLIGAKLEDLGTYPYSDKKPVQKNLFTQDEDFKATVKQVIDDYYRIKSENSDTRQNIENKKKYLDEIDTLLKPYKDLCNLHTSIYFGNDIDEEDYEQIVSDKLIAIEDYFDDYFHWELEFPELLIKKNGLDCIIGNPPWGAVFSKLEKDYLKETYRKVHKRTFDSYNYFLFKSTQLLSPNGAQTFIIPNSLFFQHDFENSRNYFLSNYLIGQVINLGDNIFKGVTQPCGIFNVLKDSDTSHECAVADLRNTTNQLKSIKYSKMFQNDIINDSGSVFSFDPKLIEIQKILPTTTLDNFVDLVNSGVTTGSKQAFTFSDKFIIEKYELEQKLIKRVASGRDFSRYHNFYNELDYLIYVDRYTDIDNYPNTKTYLSLFYDDLVNRSEVKQGILNTFALGRSRSSEMFENDKIILRETGDTIKAYFDTSKTYVLNSVIVIHVKEGYNPYYILALLNSRFINFMYQELSQEKGRVFAKTRPNVLRKLPIPDIKNESELLINNSILNKLQASSEHDFDYFSELKNEIIENVVQQKSLLLIHDYISILAKIMQDLLSNNEDIELVKEVDSLINTCVDYLFGVHNLKYA